MSEKVQEERIEGESLGTNESMTKNKERERCLKQMKGVGEHNMCWERMRGNENRGRGVRKG